MSSEIQKHLLYVIDSKMDFFSTFQRFWHRDASVKGILTLTLGGGDCPLGGANIVRCLTTGVLALARHAN